MSLTGVPLILLAAAVTAGTLAVTVLLWRRWGRWRYVVRPAGVLLAEALLTATVGLAVNRSQQFYPTWAALFASSDPGGPSYHTAAGRLDTWLAGRPDPEQAQAFPWQPPGWRRWRLAGPPTVTVPAGYLQHPGWQYSAVLVVADAAHAWAVPAMSGPTVLVSVTTTADTRPAALGVTVPGELGRDLRVTGHRWALITSAGDNALARRVVTVARGRYPAVAFVGTAAPGAHTLAVRTQAPAAARSSRPSTTRPSVKLTQPKPKPKPKPGPGPGPKPGPGPGPKPGSGSKPGPSAGASHPVHGVGASRAAGYDNSSPLVHRPPAAGTLPAGVETAYFPAAGNPPALAGPLRAALSWAAAQTPPPLAASAPEPTYIPIPPKKTHRAKPKHSGAPRHVPLPHTTPTPAGGPDGSGQPRP
jgi:hypothetical protein